MISSLSGRQKPPSDIGKKRPKGGGFRMRTILLLRQLPGFSVIEQSFLGSSGKENRQEFEGDHIHKKTEYSADYKATQEQRNENIFAHLQKCEDLFLDIPKLKACHGTTNIKKKPRYFRQWRTVPDCRSQPIIEGINWGDSKWISNPDRDHCCGSVHIKKCGYQNRKDKLHSDRWGKRYKCT